MMSFNRGLSLIQKKLPQTSAMGNYFSTVNNKTITACYSNTQTCVSSVFKMAFESKFVSGLDSVINRYKESLYEVSDHRYSLLKGTSCNKKKEKLLVSLIDIKREVEFLPNTHIRREELSDEEGRRLIDDGHLIIVHLPVSLPQNQRCKDVSHFTPHHLMITGYDDSTYGWVVKNPSPKNNNYVLNQLRDESDRAFFRSNLYTPQDVSTVEKSNFLLKLNRVFDNFLKPLGGRGLIPQFIIVKQK